MENATKTPARIAAFLDRAFDALESRLDQPVLPLLTPEIVELLGLETIKQLAISRYSLLPSTHNRGEDRRDVVGAIHHAYAAAQKLDAEELEAARQQTRNRFCAAYYWEITGGAWRRVWWGVTGGRTLCVGK